MEHPYSALCGCNACEIEGHARDNIGDYEREEDERWERAYEEKIEAEELSEARRVESEENERTEREDSYAIEF